MVYTNAQTTTYSGLLTVTDSRGMTTTTSVPVTSVTMTGNWAGSILGIPISLTLTQFTGGFVTGTWSQPALSGHGEIGPQGEPGVIRADGTFELRFKVLVGAFADFYFRGSISPTGQQLTGTLHDSGFSGEPMVVNKVN